MAVDSRTAAEMTSDANANANSTPDANAKCTTSNANSKPTTGTIIVMAKATPGATTIGTTA